MRKSLLVAAFAALPLASIAKDQSVLAAYDTLVSPPGPEERDD